MTTPTHRADRHEDSCSLECGGPGYGNCSTYVGRHRAGPTS